MVNSLVMIKDCSAYILIGGKSERMGRNKALLKWNGSTFVEHLFNKLNEVFINVFVITKSISEYVDVLNEKIIIQDLYEKQSPIIGILTALKHTTYKKVFIKACDNPIINASLVKEMHKYSNDYDVVVPLASDGLHPLYAFYSTSLLPKIEEMVNKNNFKIISLYDNAKVKYLKEDDLRLFDNELICLRNINTPNEFYKFKKLFGKEKK